MVAEGATLALGGPFAMLPLLEGAPGGFDMDAMKVLDSIHMLVPGPVPCASQSILPTNHCKHTNTNSRRATRITGLRTRSEGRPRFEPKFVSRFSLEEKKLRYSRKPDG